MDRAVSHLGERTVALRRHHRVASALLHIFPGVGVVVDGGGARAGGAGAGRAIVLARERNAIALVGAGLDRGRAGLGGAGQSEGGEVVPGTDPGAPAMPYLARKLVWTTLVSLAIFAACYVIYVNRLVTLEGLMRPFGAR